MEQKINTRGLVESSIMAAIIVIIVIVSTIFPFIYGIAILLLPTVVGIVQYKYNVKYSIGCIITSVLIVAMVIDPITAITMGIGYGIVGLTLGYCVRKKYSVYKILVLTVLASILVVVVNFWLTGLIISGENIFESIKNQAIGASEKIAQSIEEAKKIYSSMGISETQLAIMDQMKQNITPEFLLTRIPAAIAVLCFLQGYISFSIFLNILKRLKVAVIEPMKFEKFYVTNLFGAALITIMCIAIILAGRGLSGAHYVYNTMYLITIVILGINGIATVQYYLKVKMMLPNVARVLLIIAVFMVSSFNIFGIIGFLEMLLDFRKLDPHRLRKA